jgi:hypothetical protein
MLLSILSSRPLIFRELNFPNLIPSNTFEQEINGGCQPHTIFNQPFHESEIPKAAPHCGTAFGISWMFRAQNMKGFIKDGIMGRALIYQRA